MSIDPDRFRDAVRAIHPATLSRADAEAVVAISQLAVDADGREDPDEIASFFALGKVVYELAGLKETPSPTFSDEELDERVRVLSTALSSTAAKELAYAVAYVMMVSDIDLAESESQLGEQLREALGITEDRADELTAQISAAVTPMN